mgnify:CR=1 FL=1|jgi:hypothetical protein
MRLIKSLLASLVLYSSALAAPAHKCPDEYAFIESYQDAVEAKSKSGYMKHHAKSIGYEILDDSCQGSDGIGDRVYVLANQMSNLDLPLYKLKKMNEQPVDKTLNFCSSLERIAKAMPEVKKTKNYQDNYQSKCQGTLVTKLGN